ncbi:hypothetical protein BWGOE4_19770 [Bacillus mycoides]|uniref:DUF4083 domain-containing protein n=2 Tax=Bacillus cereus group TaxID=86661 RepID=J7XFK6_BACCE|nr:MULTISPECIES: DUF4083 domain-containing protein [Bacillus cereus group]EJQ43073.1 hypothetical protein IEE_03251 [Bacillus cereus BAG5X1-1]EJV61633.1 hypothetical protein IEM_03388 [Bacillus cereus BAG6O-2]MBJ8069202.1 DUF4083 domain-containing protein [Bacillus cereus]MBJ8186777.1 DUF4083 domain-containing protein [Bacillus cereus]MDM5462121.1 DUF4083 domain-containing protein [Bacillus cereus]
MNLFENNIFTLIYTCLVIGLIVLFFVSFTLFIKRLLQNNTMKKQHVINMNQKLDRIIELLEKDKKE